MDPDRWRRITGIFHAALDVPATERGAFLSRAAAGDIALEREVKLLLSADEAVGSNLYVGIEPSRNKNRYAPGFAEFSPGEVLCNRFRILELLGEGGMGCVYKAFDTELNVAIAIKAIRPEISADPEASGRFRQEVRLARRLTHPHVCRTFDLEREIRGIKEPAEAGREIVFLTMELLEGETLASRISRRGALSLPESEMLVRQLAGALDAAGELRLVHRDIKPGNIMLCTTAEMKTRAVITDFGLARIEENLSSEASMLSKGGNPVGTLAYMAPEQLIGGPVSPATDIYSFGLVLFEMVTGKRAFPSETLLTGVTRRLGGPPPEPNAIVPELPERWCQAIRRSLQINPEARFQRAADLIACLDGDACAGSPTTLSITSVGTAGGRGLGIRLRTVFLILFVGVALSWTVFRYMTSRADSKVAPGALVYLAPVRNETDQSAFDGLTELIRSGLAQSTQITLLDQSRVGDTLQRMTMPPSTAIDGQTGREIAMRNGAVRAVFCTVSGSRGKYQLDVDVQQPDNTPARYRQHWPKVFMLRNDDGAGGDVISRELLGTIRQANDWIRRQAGESSEDIARLDVPPEEATTASWPALTAYVYAEKLVLRGKREEAVTALRGAVREDPDFALAYARLGDLLVNLHQIEDGFEAYLKALGDTDHSRLSLRERDRIKGIYAQDTWDYQASEDSFREYSIYYEHDYLGWFYRALPLSMLGRIDEAISAAKHAHEADPHRTEALTMLVQLSLVKGDLAEARRWVGEIEASHDKDAATRSRGMIHCWLQEYGSATQDFESLAHSANPSYRSLGLRELADLSAERGDHQQAIVWITQAIGENPEDASARLDRADLLASIFDFPHALEDIRDAIAKDHSPVTLLAASEVIGRAIPIAGPTHAAKLIALLASLESLLPTEQFGTVTTIAHLRIRGELLLSEGHHRAALSEFYKADKLEPSLTSREWLGRALETNAASERDPAEAKRLRESALVAYGIIARNPALLWRSPFSFSPGCYSRQLNKWLELAAVLHKHDSEYLSSLAAMQTLRSTPMPSVQTR